MTEKLDTPEWFFMWKDLLFVYPICGWTKADVIQKMEYEFKDRWKNIYSRGGRIIKCKVIPIN